MRGRLVTQGRLCRPTGTRGHDLPMKVDRVMDEEEDGKERKTGGGLLMIRKRVNFGPKIEHF